MVKPAEDNCRFLARKGALFFESCVTEKHRDTECNPFGSIVSGQRQRSSQLSSTRSQSLQTRSLVAQLTYDSSLLGARKEKTARTIPSCIPPVYRNAPPRYLLPAYLAPPPGGRGIFRGFVAEHASKNHESLGTEMKKCD